MSEDAINPKHYRGLFQTRDIQCIAVTRVLDFDLGCWFKYIFRLGNKDDALQDFNKARWYMEDWFAHHGPDTSPIRLLPGPNCWSETQRSCMPIRNPFAEKASIAFEFIEPPSMTDDERFDRYCLLQLVTDNFIIPDWWRRKMDCYAIQYLGEKQ